MSAIASINHALLECLIIFEIPRVHMDNPSIQEDVSTWRAPDKGKLKINYDVTIPSNNSKGRMEIIFRNWKGKVLDGFARSVAVCSSLMVVKLGIKDVVVEANNRQSILLSVFELVPPLGGSS